MSRDRDDKPTREIAAAVTTIGAAVYGVLTGVLSGAWSMVTGLVTLDPSLILSGAWFAPTSIITNQIGPLLAPSIPWTPIFLVGALGMLGVLLYRYSRKRKVKT